MKNRFRIPVKVGAIDAVLIREDNDIRSAKATKDTALNGRSLDVDTMIVEFEKTGSTPVFNRSQSVRVSRGGSTIGEWFIAGISQLTKTRYRLQMTSPLGRLEQFGHKGGVYTGITAGTLITEICGIGRVVVDPVFASIELYGWLPYVSPSGANGSQTGTAKDNLLQVLFAINASVRAGADGKLYVENLPDSQQSVFSADRIYRNGYELEQSEPVSDLTLTEHSFADVSASTDPDDREEVFSGVVPAGETRTIVFSQPMSDLQPAAAIAESGANYAIIEAGNWTETGSGAITAVPFLHVEREIAATVTAGAQKKTVSVTDATLVSATNSADVLARLVDYYQHTEKITFDAALQFEQPGDVVAFYDKISGSTISGCIEKITETFSQILRGTVTALVGFTPWQTGAFTEEVEILTGSGSWQVPEGVTSLTAVIIGGGGGGAAGQNGEDAPICEQKSENGFVGCIYPSYPTYGHGGDGGDGGNGGKILRVTLTVTPGSQIGYTCGIGGAGAAAGGAADAKGAAGTHSTFGGNDSDDGNADPYGFMDPTTGTIYGGTGAKGVNGGDGGGYNRAENALTTSPNPVPGQSVEFNGMTFQPGENGVRQTRVSVSDRRTYIQDGSFGGGAAAGSDGSDGTDAVDPLPVTNWFAIGGGDGGNAVAPPAPNFGVGGSGGNGGGGAGSAGFWARTAGTATYAETQIGAGVGGAGSAGGVGGAGCVLLYYRRPSA